MVDAHPFAMKTRNVLLMVALGISAACSTTQVHTGSLDTAPYAEFHTFSFAPIQGGVAGYRSTPRSARVVDLMKTAVTEALEKKGYRPAPEGESDLVIVCSAGRRDVEQRIELPWRMTAITGEEFEDRDFVQGGLVVDVFDRSGGQVWHGAAKTEIDPAKPNDARVHSIVENVMSAFPPRPK